MMRRAQIIAALVSLLLIALTLAPVRDFLSGAMEARADALSAYPLASLDRPTRGAVLFALDDFGALDTHALETHAVPWRLAGAALALDAHELSGAPVSAATLRDVMRSYGFLYPDTIGDWPAGARAPAYDSARATPLGMTVGVLRRSAPAVSVTVANLGCASCHAGVVYDAEGAPTNTAWLGAPNTSLDLEAYVQGVYRAFVNWSDRPDKLFAAVQQVFPDTSAQEMQSLRAFVLPRVRQRLAKIGYAGGGPLPFVNGAPGITNGVAALKMQLKLLGREAHRTALGFTSIPDLGDRIFRTSLLSDGAYAPPAGSPDIAVLGKDLSDAHLDALADITGFFTVPSMGVAPAKAIAHSGEARDVYRFLRTYAAPRFPGPVNVQRARDGQSLYSERCAECHGAYDASLDHPRLVHFPNRILDYDTDPERAKAFSADLAATVNGSPYGAKIEARATGGYVAPILSGVWMSAPYLHNGSVPTLHHLLYPGERPRRFMVGGHRLNLDLVGIDGQLDADGVWAYPPGYTPFAGPHVIDTTAPGFSNRGHEKDFEDFTPAEKDALIEYLKLL